MNDLAAVLPQLLPLAISRVKAEEAHALAMGRPLLDVEAKHAHAVGVQRPDQVRIKIVSQLPQPDHPELLAVANQTGLLGPNMGGVTFGHAIFIRQGQVTNRLVSHELRHVHQYESFGSIGAFLAIYLDQIATVGYDNAPLVFDARQHERDAP
jgi:hypothetical protein